MTVTARIEADLAVIPDAVNIGPRTVVALPPSDADPLLDEMQVYVNGRLVFRAYDPELVQP